MRKFEILPHTADVAVKVTASTKAGLAIAALQGMFAASKPRIKDEDAADVKHPFSLEAADFPSLLVDLLNEAVAGASDGPKMFRDISFTLITDKKAFLSVMRVKLM